MIYTVNELKQFATILPKAAQEAYIRDANIALKELWDGLEMMDRVIYEDHRGEFSIDGEVIGVDSETGWIKVKDLEGAMWIDSDSGYWTYGPELEEWVEGI